jgi:hypothetical protein
MLNLVEILTAEQISYPDHFIGIWTKPVCVYFQFLQTACI